MNFGLQNSTRRRRKLKSSWVSLKQLRNPAAEAELNKGGYRSAEALRHPKIQPVGVRENLLDYLPALIIINAKRAGK